MRRVPDHLLQAVVFLYPTLEAAIEGKGYGGSGFLVGMTESNEFDAAGPPLRDPAHAYVVTNAHVAATCSFIRTSHQLQPIIRIESWTNHPGGDDIAIAHLGILGIDTIALGKIVHRSFFVTPDILQTAQIGPGDQLFMTGRFTGLDERERTQATVRAGTLSIGSTIPVRNDALGVMQESFFAEVNSKAGYSGSPVYVEIPPELPWPSPIVGFPHRPPYLGLLGITWGIWRSYVPLLDSQTHQQTGDRVLHENSGIELVIPAWRIMEVLQDEGVERHRHEAVAAARRDQPHSRPEAVATSEVPHDDPPVIDPMTLTASHDIGQR
jgi:hypothetical protein